MRRNCIIGAQIDTYLGVRPLLTCDDYQPPVRSKSGTCSATGYTLIISLMVISSAWGVGDPHFTSLDGANFTFNGWGEYLLLKFSNGRTQFELQSRMEPVPGSTATVLVAFAFAMLRYSPVEVRFNSGELEVYLNGTNYTDVLDTTNDTFTTDFLSITRTSPNSILATFPNQMGVAVSTTASILSFTMIVPRAFRNLTRGKLDKIHAM